MDGHPAMRIEALRFLGAGRWIEEPLGRNPVSGEELRRPSPHPATKRDLIALELGSGIILGDTLYKPRRIITRDVLVIEMMRVFMKDEAPRRRPFRPANAVAKDRDHNPLVCGPVETGNMRRFV